MRQGWELVERRTPPIDSSAMLTVLEYLGDAVMVESCLFVAVR